MSQQQQKGRQDGRQRQDSGDAASKQPARQDKGKGRASDERSPFEPEQPRQGPQIRRDKASQGTLSSTDEAKRRLVRSKSSSVQPDQESRSTTPTLQGNSASPSKSGSRAPSPTKARSAYGSEAGYGSYSQVTNLPRLRIREDVTKSTSFDRERDGELYDLWVGPP